MPEHTTAIEALLKLAKSTYVIGNIARILHLTDNTFTIFDEDNPIEITFKNVTICISWDMISAVNNITNEWFDLTTEEKAESVFGRIY